MDGFHNLTLVEAPIPELKSTQVLVKVHAVSLQVRTHCLFPHLTPFWPCCSLCACTQYRDLIVAKGEFPFLQTENPVPGSDMAGEIVALGEDVTKWTFGERVCSNFATDHLFGDIIEEIKATSPGKGH